MLIKTNTYVWYGIDKGHKIRYKLYHKRETKKINN